jgi:hypothetical protein
MVQMALTPRWLTCNELAYRKIRKPWSFQWQFIAVNIDTLWNRSMFMT